MPTIPLDEAREAVWSRLFASKCVKLTQDQWDMIFELQHKDRVPAKLNQKLEHALWLREKLDGQLKSAAQWLIERGLHQRTVDQAALNAALHDEFGVDDPQRPLSILEVENLLKEYLGGAGGQPSQDAALKSLETTGRKFSRGHAREAYKKLSPAPVSRGRPRLK